jgi:hypothetical protein
LRKIWVECGGRGKSKIQTFFHTTRLEFVVEAIIVCWAYAFGKRGNFINLGGQLGAKLTGKHFLGGCNGATSWLCFARSVKKLPVLKAAAWG